MKTRFFFLLVCCILQAQAQNKDCKAQVSKIDALVKENRLAEADSLYTTISKCATANDTIYKAGEKILQYKIDQSGTPDEKQARIQKLFALYDAYDKTFPANNKSHSVKKALLQRRYKFATDDETYTLLDRAFKNDAANFTDANGLYVYFDLYFARFKAGDEGVTENDIFVRQDAVSLKLNQLNESNASGSRDYLTALNGIKALVAPIATCEKLLAFYGKDLEAKKTDATWLEAASATLLSKNCSADKLFLNMADMWYKAAPNAKSAYNLGLANMRNRNRDKGFEYFNIAASQETNPESKAKIYYSIATSLATTDKLQALDYSKKALAAQPTFGKPYLLMAQMYSGAADCGATPFEKKAVYLLAAQTARKAADADPSMKNVALKQAKSYMDKAPSKAEIKEEKMAGKKVSYKCWINESVIVPES